MAMPPKKREIKLPRGYHPRTQRVIGLMMAQLDDQTKLLKQRVAGLEVVHLEWQPQPGMNTIGMLLAHMAIAEYWWTSVAPYGHQWDDDGAKLFQKGLGIHPEDDGMPQKPDGLHPAKLSGKTVDVYLSLIDKARRASHKSLKSWNDAQLPRLYARGKGRQVSYLWTIYHALEHFSGHYGQILLLMHQMRAAGVLAAEPNS